VLMLTSSSSLSDCLATNAGGIALARFDAAIVYDTTRKRLLLTQQSMMLYIQTQQETDR